MQEADDAVVGEEQGAEARADESLYSTREHRFGSTSVLLRCIAKDDDYYGKKINLTGTSTWFAASAFCKWACSDENVAALQFGDKSILELGSGAGLAGIALYKCLQRIGHPSSFLLTDGEEEVVDLVRRNIALNSAADDPTIACQQLWWGPSAALDKLKHEHPTGFDVIIGCDLFYNQAQADSGAVLGAFQVVAQLLSRAAQGSCFLLAFTRRDLDVAVVLEAAARCGFVSAVEEECCCDIFGTWTQGQTEFWRDAVYRFTRLADTVSE